MSLKCPRCGADVERLGTMCDNCNYFLPLDTRSESAPETSAGSGPASGLLGQARALTLERPAVRIPQPRSWLRGKLVIAAAAVIFLGATGAAASALPVLPLKPDKSVAAMLPASTAAYISADLNPTGATRANLQRLQQAFTSQPGWRNVQRQYNGQTSGKSSQSTCYRDVTGGVQQQLSVLGHDTTIALIGTKGLNLSNTLGASDPTPAFKRQAVLLAPLNVRVPLVERLLGIGLSMPQHSTTYRGVTIYKQRFPSCGQVTKGSPDTYYAAFLKGYVVGGLLPDPIERIIDTDADHAATLATDAQYQSLMSRLPAGSIGSYYVNGPAVQHTGLANAAGSTGGFGSISGSAVSAATKSSAGALVVEPDGVKLTFAGYTGTQTSTLPAAGQAASILPPDVLAEISLGNAPALLKTWVRQAEASGIWDTATRSEIDTALSDVTSPMKGEADLVLFRSPKGTRLTSAFTLPLTLMWPVSDDASALQGLDHAAKALHQRKTFRTATLPDGTVARLERGMQAGYAVRHGWAIASLQVRPAIDSLSRVSGQTLAETAGYKSALPAGGTATSVWYVNTDALRRDLESSILPTEPRAMVTTYKNDALPILAPFRSISGSASQSANQPLAVSTIKVRITAAP